jgi:uncharacterized membrane protein
LVAWLFSWFGALIIVLYERQRTFTLFHGIQSLIISPVLFTLVVALLFTDLTAFVVVSTISAAICFGFMVKATFDASKQHFFHLPFKIGEFAEREARKYASGG